MMIKRLFKNPSFLAGFFFIGLLLLLSFVYPFLIKPHLELPPSMLYKDGKLVDLPPYPPSWTYLFGVDRFGGDVFWMVIDGAKYTILIAVFVGVLRIFLAVGGGIIYAFYYK